MALRIIEGQMNTIPTLPRLLGLAGLLPQFAFAFAVWFGADEWRWTALALALG